MEGNNPSEGKVCVPLVTLLDHYLLALVGLVGLTTSHQTLKERRDSNISRRDIRALFVLPSGTNHAQRCSIELSDALTHGSPLPPSISSQGAFLYLSPPPAGLSPWLSTLEPCPIRRKTSGPMILTPHRSNTRCTLQRKPISLGLFLVQHPMVRRLMLSSTRAHFFCSVPRRGCHRSVFSIHEDVTQSRRSHKGHQVAACGPHCGYVLVCDDLRCGVPGSSIHFFHRQARVQQ